MAREVKDICINCGSCEAVCPRGAISLQGAHRMVNEALCVDCMKCEAVCPVRAIRPLVDLSRLTGIKLEKDTWKMERYHEGVCSSPYSGRGCACPNTDCPFHGRCCDCVHAHIEEKLAPDNHFGGSYHWLPKCLELAFEGKAYTGVYEKRPEFHPPEGMPPFEPLHGDGPKPDKP